MEIEALLAEHLGPARRQLERRRILREQMLTGEIELQSPDRTVKITQTCAGEVVAIDIAPGTFERYDERSFAKILTSALQTARRAGHQAAEQMTDEIVREQEARRGR